MAPTCVHDLQSKRFISSLRGEVIRCYPLAMARVENQPMPVRHVVLSDCSGWILVKLWGPDAIHAAIGQFIQIHNAWCYQKDENLWLSVGRKSRLTFRTQP